MKKTPLQMVKEQFGSKTELADKLISVLDRPEDEDEGDFRRRIRTASNRQLLRLWAAEEKVKSDFGSKDKLIEAIVALKFGSKGDADYKGKISRYTKTRLLDLHGSLAQASS